MVGGEDKHVGLAKQGWHVVPPPWEQDAIREQAQVVCAAVEVGPLGPVSYDHTARRSGDTLRASARADRKRSNRFSGCIRPTARAIGGPAEFQGHVPVLDLASKSSRSMTFPRTLIDSGSIPNSSTPWRAASELAMIPDGSRKDDRVQRPQVLPLVVQFVSHCPDG